MACKGKLERLLRCRRSVPCTTKLAALFQVGKAKAWQRAPKPTGARASAPSQVGLGTCRSQTVAKSTGGPKQHCARAPRPGAERRLRQPLHLHASISESIAGALAHRSKSVVGRSGRDPRPNRRQLPGVRVEVIGGRRRHLRTAGAAGDALDEDRGVGIAGHHQLL